MYHNEKSGALGRAARPFPAALYDAIDATPTPRKPITLMRLLGRRFGVPYMRLLGAYLQGASFLKGNRKPETPTQVRNVAFARLLWGGDVHPRYSKARDSGVDSLPLFDFVNQGHSALDIASGQIEQKERTEMKTQVFKPRHERYSRECLVEGQFKKIHKLLLNIDPSYQRAQRKSSVSMMSASWNWRSFSVLSVFEREDGSFWVFDGGHRLQAALLREDITLLPCMVHKMSNGDFGRSEEEEAKGFLHINKTKNTVSAVDEHRAAVLANDEVSLHAQRILSKYGYRTQNTGHGTYCFAAIGTFKQLVQEDIHLAEKVFSVCASIAQGGKVAGETLDAIFRCQKKLNGIADILSGNHLERLKSYAMIEIEKAIRQHAAIYAKGGGAIGALAILSLLNKKRKKENHLSFPTE